MRRATAFPSLAALGWMALVLAAGCAGPAATLRGGGAPERGLRPGLAGADDPVVHGARILPEALGEAHAWDLTPEPGGGARVTVGGLRVVSWPDGAVTGAGDRLPSTPSSVVEVPERMGGGFLFAMGPHLWRAETWLGQAAPFVSLAGSITQVQVGLDRLYLRMQGGGLFAVAPQTGAQVGLGPLPAAPTLGRMAALDAWRAVVVADLRGPLLTLDAGSTWRPLALPLEVTDVVPLDDGIAVGGHDEAHQTEWWEVRPDGQVGRLTSAPGAGASASQEPSHEPSTRVFGERPLATAIADGWLLRDGTALVARDGNLGRVRMSDGALLETAVDAFPLKPARCHPLRLGQLGVGRPGDAAAFGFVCGEPRGRTVVYRYAPAEGRLVEMRRFDGPRQVQGFDNGALMARGPCAPDGADDPTSDTRAFCLMPPGGAWTEMLFSGDDVDRARPVVLHDGRVAVVRPPRGDDLSTLRLTLTDGVRSTHVPVQMPAMGADVARALRVGLWMDGFEERREGVLGGWVDAGGSVVGVEIALDGQAKVGRYIRSASDVFVAGRWGLGWTASRRGIETVDGGMTWKDFDVPDPVVPARAVRERACGPLGCLAAGWMRVGWGEPERPALKEVAAHAFRSNRAPDRLELDCVSRSGRVPEPRPSPARGRPAVHLPYPILPGGHWGSLGGSGQPGSSELPAFDGRPAPAFGADDLGISMEVPSGFDVERRGLSSSGTVYAWGPKSGDWDQLGRWSVSWLWAFGGWPEVRSSAVAAAPWSSIDGARRALQMSGGGNGGWTVASGDDPDHALLLTRALSPTTTTSVMVLESERVPFEVRRAGGEPFPDVQSAQRVGGRWYLATVQPQGELSATVIWMVDGAVAREVARVPRVVAAPDTQLTTVRLAWRPDGRAIGLLVDGPQDWEHGSAWRWVVSVDLESGTVGEPEAIAPADLSDRTVRICTGEDTGWEVDVPYAGRVMLFASPAASAELMGGRARMRLSKERACVERMMGAINASGITDLKGNALAHLLDGSGARTSATSGARVIDVRVMAPGARAPYALRCSLR